MEEALRTLEDEPLKGRKIRLEKVCGGVCYLRIVSSINLSSVDPLFFFVLR